jgi:Contractile injection system tube protein
MALAKATLTELDQKFETEKPSGQKVEVQFNPETLKVTFANAIVQPQGGDQAAGNSGRQFVGAGTTKLALQLWFDVTAMEKDPVDDVRRVTQKVVYFMTPQKSDADPKKLSPPGVQFQWGSFLFKGTVEALEETLEYFSPDGKPLRASINLTLSQQKILEAEFKGDGKVPTKPGQAPLKAAKQGDSLQNMAAKSGKDDWQSIAAGNGIEDPLRMAPGALVDLNVGAGIGAGGSFGANLGASLDFGATASFDAGVNASIGTTGSLATVGVGAGLNASLGGSASASLSLG